jgi:hypothetical protein
MARVTAWGLPIVGELSHHVTQNAAPAPHAIMRRPSDADRGQKQGASKSTRPSETIRRKTTRPLAHVDYRGTPPTRTPYGHHKLPNNHRAASGGGKMQTVMKPVAALYPAFYWAALCLKPMAMMKSAHPCPVLKRGLLGARPANERLRVPV